ncbi:3-hydroxyacyl-CoA dehydrogenase [Sphingomonas canadensis]|uniref:3-hydroxyacyl-CoA dehydrogenase n=1 Tax=Sphingomonas canadensis TaxID=1219257 RepID=A0ABW3H7A3_9SPHN|nr:3-hydroxyacyl-CoA dehydrogenase [Sphingomonas canadensis]MCW3836964.1 3-hydroxyacyl-CoA dehydrogenase [Sphingomonas canadensis]
MSMLRRRMRVAIIGCGVIGRSWAVVFARAGAEVRLYDQNGDAAQRAPAVIAETLRGQGMKAAEVRAIEAALLPVDSLAEALGGAQYAQESIAETVAAKRAIFEQMDAVAPRECILASSCSSIPPAEFLGGLAGEWRSLIAHPFNPPHLIPLVELVPAPGTAEKVVARARRLLAGFGQHPVLLHKPVEGFIGNRLQAAVVSEIMHLIGEGVASPADIDACLRLGLGLRWAMMGPLETMDLNADGGIADYIGKFGKDYQALSRKLGIAEPWREEAVAAAIESRRAALPIAALRKRMGWRDRNLLRLRQLLEAPARR